jgi:hypothetical protein
LLARLRAVIARHIQPEISRDAVLQVLRSAIWVVMAVVLIGVLLPAAARAAAAG